MKAFADILLAFHGAGELSPQSHVRAGLAWQQSFEIFDCRLFHAYGSPLAGELSVYREVLGWHVWCLGEVAEYLEQRGTAACVTSFATDLGDGQARPEKLNGHFLLFAWSEADREWHVWTDRFGTLHAYYATDGVRAAVGTFSPAVAHLASKRRLDWRGLTGFFAFGFFPQDRTFFEDVRILRPASHYLFSERGRLIRQERYWQWWHKPAHGRSYADTVAEFADILGKVIDQQTCRGRIALPISGGLDSRSTVAALNGQRHHLHAEDRLWSYSYGYVADSGETDIARQIAKARSLPFESFTIRPYLFDTLDEVLASVEGFQDVTQSRQAAITQEIGRHADYLIAAHWGDVWLDDMGLAGGARPRLGPEQVVAHAKRRVEKGGAQWLLDQICRQNLGESAEGFLRGVVRDELRRVEHLADADFQIKAFKTDQWSFRWTAASLRMFQAGAFPRLPFYDTSLTDFFCTVPSTYVTGRRLQIDYLKRFAPCLARIKWQAYDTNLLWHKHYNSLLLPKRLMKKAMRAVGHNRPPARNWEVQFLSDQGRRRLEQCLLTPGLKLLEFVPTREVRALLDDFYADPLGQKRGYTVSMLLTFSAWLERYA